MRIPRIPFDLTRCVNALILAMVICVHGTVAAEDGGIRFTMESLERTRGNCSGGPCVTLRVQFPLIESGLSARGKDSLNVFIQETLLGKFDPHGVAPVLDAVADTVAAQFRGSQDVRNPVPST